MQQDLFVNSAEAETYTPPIHYIPVSGKVSEVTISYSHTVPAGERKIVRGIKESVDILKPYFEDIELRERVYILLLNHGQQVLGVWMASAGGICSTIADIRMILVTALKSHATRIIMAHNHPSGTLSPSDADRTLTRQLKVAATQLDIVLLDHVIITQDGYFSFADQGIL